MSDHQPRPRIPEPRGVAAGAPQSSTEKIKAFLADRVDSENGRDESVYVLLQDLIVPEASRIQPYLPTSSQNFAEAIRLELDSMRRILAKGSDLEPIVGSVKPYDDIVVDKVPGTLRNLSSELTRLRHKVGILLTSIEKVINSYERNIGEERGDAVHHA